jgi:hypothetical protein
MKNVYDVLEQKEADRTRLQTEIEALRLVIPLLDENANTSESDNITRPAPSHEAKPSNEAVASHSNDEKQSTGSWWKLASH